MKAKFARFPWGLKRMTDSHGVGKKIVRDFRENEEAL